MPNKRRLKTTIAKAQDGLCALTAEPLKTELPLMDTDRLTPKQDGGVYTEENTRIVDPVAHMQRHGIWRDREEALDILKSLFDDRVQMMKLLMKENNQLLAYKRRVDHQNPETFAFLEEHKKPIQKRIDVIDKALTASILSYPDPLATRALQVMGLGPITVSALTVYVDLKKADSPSSLWKYVGIHTSSHERYVKGEAGGGNQTLRTVLWNAAIVMMKLGEGGYRDVYDRTKLRLSVSEKIVKTRNTEGKLIECAWKDTKPSHRHGAALRAIMKHILTDYWVVGRTLAGLPTRPLYALEYLGHEHQSSPTERGWTI